jgi:hypothetical protein
MALYSPLQVFKTAIERIPLLSCPWGRRHRCLITPVYAEPTWLTLGRLLLLRLLMQD